VVDSIPVVALAGIREVALAATPAVIANASFEFGVPWCSLVA
jgi:hypothetical protein